MLFEDLNKANMQALKDHDKTARAILSVVYGKCKQVSIDKGLNAKSLDDLECLRIIQKTIKELEEEKNGYLKAGRMDTAAEIEAQSKVLEKYLPQMMSEEEIRTIISGLEDKSVPSVMKHFKMNYAGKVEMGTVSKVLKEFN